MFPDMSRTSGTLLTVSYDHILSVALTPECALKQSKHSRHWMQCKSVALNNQTRMHPYSGIDWTLKECGSIVQVAHANMTLACLC